MNGLAGVVLAGGEGRRLGGAVKPLLRVGGFPILERTLEKLRPFMSPLLVSTGRIAPERFSGFVCDGLVPDWDGPSAGPLAGVFAAADHLRRSGAVPEWLFTATGDCPNLPDDLPSALLAAATDGADAVVATYAGQSYPPIALWRFPALLARFDALGGETQGRGPRQLFAAERSQSVDFSGRYDSNPFDGLNTLADVVRLARERQGMPAH